MEQLWSYVFLFVFSAGHKSVLASTMCVFFSSTESPLQFYVNNANSPNVTAYGPGLVYGIANKPATFTIYTEDAAEGGHQYIVYMMHEMEYKIT